MPALRSLTAGAFLFAAVAAPAALAADDGSTFAIRAGRVLPVSPGQPWEIAGGVVLVVDGKISAVGADVAIPPGVRVIDLPGSVVMPGLVAASTDLAGSHRGDESVGAGYAAIDAFDRYGDFRRVLAGGVTTVHIDPGAGRLISGRGAVVRLGGPADERVLSGSSDLTVSFLDPVYGPGNLVDPLIPPSSNRAIAQPTPQRPGSRVSRVLALKEAVEIAVGGSYPAERAFHMRALASAWQENLPLRFHADRGEDVSGALDALAAVGRTGYVVGGAGASQAAGRLRKANTPLVYELDGPLGSPGRNIGIDIEAAAAAPEELGKLRGVTLALAPRAGTDLADFLRVAGVAQRGGLTEREAVEAITRTPAEILGVSDRVGSIAPGMLADLVVLTGDPLETTTHVSRVYAGGRLVYRAAGEADALVVRAGTVWLGPDDWLQNGSVLVEDGKIVAVGKSVPHPPHARVIDAGPGAFITPGLIDAMGHLGLRGDTGAAGPEVSLAKLAGVADDSDLRVARAGVTTVLTAPYRFGQTGSRLSAVKTAGADRDGRVVADIAGIAFDVRGSDPAAIEGRLKPRVEAGKAYAGTWKKYRDDLAEWEKKRAEGKLVEAEPKVVEEAAAGGSADPLTGTWSGRVSGGPIPPGEEPEGKIALKLTGNQFEGRVVDPPAPIEHRITGTLDGKRVTGQIEIDTGGMGNPTFEGTIDPEDVFTGTISFQGIQVTLNGRRIDKSAVEFKVGRSKRRVTGKDGRPLPPKVDEALEPMRAAIEGRAAVVVNVDTPANIDAVLNVLVGQYELPVVLLNAEGAADKSARLKEKGVGVIVPARILRYEQRKRYHQADDLQRRGVPFAFQSEGEDSARTLPLVGMYAVSQGLSAEAALDALTRGAAGMLKIDGRVGSIEPGKDADLVIFSGPPFAAASRVEHVIVSGEEVP